MATPTTRAQFRDYCLRQLGHPVIQINIDEDQMDDRIDQAIQFFNDYHYDGAERIFMKHCITQSDIDRGWIYTPEAITFVVGVLPFDQASSSINMFDMRYQLRLHDLYDFTSVSYVSYEITMQHLQTLNLLFSGTPQYRFNRHGNKLRLDIDWTRDVKVGDYVVIECYRTMSPDSITLSGTGAISTSSNTVTGTSTVFDQQVIPDDEVVFGTETKRITKVISPTQVEVDSPFATSGSVTMTKTGISDVWNDRWLKRYGTALFKLQWGNNLSKFSGIQMPGGVTLDGVRIMGEAQTEIDKLEEDLVSTNVLPGDMYVG
jgi:hypothetical protein